MAEVDWNVVVSCMLAILFMSIGLSICCSREEFWFRRSLAALDDIKKQLGESDALLRKITAEQSPV